MQIQLQLQAQAGGQRQQQQQQRAKSAQPYYSYSIDMRLMSRSNGCFRCAAAVQVLALRCHTKPLQAILQCNSD
jgi:hypothetical protein